MDNNTPAAAAPATDATPNTNSTTPTADAPAPTTEPTTSAPKEADEFDNFVTANGGKEKVLSKMKQAIGDPVAYARSVLENLEPKNQPQAQTATTAPVAPTAPAPVQETKVPDGYITPNEIVMLQYNKDLASEYPELKDYVANGEYIKEATSMGMNLMDANGNLNDKVIHKWLDIKKATIPPAPTPAPVTATPTAEYTMVDGNLDSRQKAEQVLRQGAGHPQYHEAVKFMAESVLGKQYLAKSKTPQQ